MVKTEEIIFAPTRHRCAIDAGKTLGGLEMSSSIRYASWPAGISLAAVLAFACSSVDEKPAPTPVAPAAKAAPTPAPAKAEAVKTSKTKAVEVDGVISAVGQRTITFQVERKGKVREEVVGVDEKTKIEKGGSNVKLRDLQVTDKALINYEPNAYTPAIAIKVTGKGEIKKAGGDD
jgi:hypothetical protein